MVDKLSIYLDYKFGQSYPVNGNPVIGNEQALWFWAMSEDTGLACHNCGTLILSDHTKLIWPFLESHI